MNSPRSLFRDVSAHEAARLVREGAVRIVDVRTPDEYARLGHIPGAVLLPVDLMPVAPATLDRTGRPILVYCEHGIRSAHAAQLLVQAGFPAVFNMTGGMSCWKGARDHAPGSPFGDHGPSSWLVTNARLLPEAGDVLDVACGRGRHALLLASIGLDVHAVDRDVARIEALGNDAARLGLPVRAEVLDLEAAQTDLGRHCYDVVLGIHYLHRSLFAALIEALRPGGILLYETFTVHQAMRGHPRNPDFLLRSGELLRLVEPLEILEQREGQFDGRMVAGVAARKLSS